MTMAALRYYVSIPYPYPFMIWAASFCAIEIALLFLRNRRKEKTSLPVNALAFLLDAVMFAAGAAAALYGLLVIYPPNN